MTISTAPLFPVEIVRFIDPDLGVLTKERWEVIAGRLSRGGWSVAWCQCRAADSGEWQAEASKDGLQHRVTASDLTSAFAELEVSIRRAIQFPPNNP